MSLLRTGQVRSLPGYVDEMLWPHATLPWWLSGFDSLYPHDRQATSGAKGR